MAELTVLEQIELGEQLTIPYMTMPVAPVKAMYDAVHSAVCELEADTRCLFCHQEMDGVGHITECPTPLLLDALAAAWGEEREG